MIVKFTRAGASFKGLAQYLTHDPEAQTSERVAWTHTLNLANDHIPSAIDEMYRSYRDAELLKEEAGVKRGGRALEKPVKHVSLNWHPDDEPTKAHMIETAESFLKHMGWNEHQAVIVAHNDKEYEHLHIELNALHPETGLKLDDGLERRRAQSWALEYERNQEQIRCQQREIPAAEREDAPTRAGWEIMKEAEQKHRQNENERRGDHPDPQQTATNEDAWAILKRQQREEREAFFAGGKEAYKQTRDDAFREVREEFRPGWRDYYAAKKDGIDVEALALIKADLLSHQREALENARNDMIQQLREQRDEEYAELLAAQKIERANVKAHLIMGHDGSEALAHIHADKTERLQARNDNDPLSQDMVLVTESPAAMAVEFRQAAREVCVEFSVSDADVHEDVEASRRGETAAENPRVRDGIDIGAGLGVATIGGALTLGERLFDGFLDDAPRPVRKPTEVPSEPREAPRDLFAAAAASARRSAELEDEKARRNEWWDERRARARD